MCLVLLGCRCVLRAGRARSLCLALLAASAAGPRANLQHTAASVAAQKIA